MLKKLFFLSIASMLLITTSCSKDSDTESIPTDETDVNLQEEQPIELSILEEGIEIQGATKKTGTPPTPTENIDFSISSDENEAYQKAGFNINFSSTDEIAGAYIQFTDVDGSPINGYFDVPISEIKDSSSFKLIGSNSTKTSSTLKSAKTSENDEGLSIDVDFEVTVPAGRFCYAICLYDSNNNISRIETVCVTVEAWGGNSSIVGEWVYNYEKYNEDYDEKSILYCTNGNQLEVDYIKYLKNERTLVLNADGDYQETFFEEYTFLNEPETENTCNAVYDEGTLDIHFLMVGNWAYNEEAGTLTTIDFSSENLETGTKEIFPGGQFFSDGIKAEVILGQLVLTDYPPSTGQIIYYDRK